VSTLIGRLIKLFKKTETPLRLYNGGPHLERVASGAADYKGSLALKSCHTEFHISHWCGFSLITRALYHLMEGLLFVVYPMEPSTRRRYEKHTAAYFSYVRIVFPLS